MIALVIVIVGWFVLGYLAGRITIYTYKKPFFGTYAAFVTGPLGYVMAIGDSLLERGSIKPIMRAHFIPAFAIKGPNKRLQARAFGITLEDE